MQKRSYFNSTREKRWPTPEEIRHFFFAPKGQEWFSTGGNDTGSFRLEGVDGTAHLGWGKGRSDLILEMYGKPGLGVLLIYKKIGAPGGFGFASKGDLSRMHQYVRTLHDDLMPVGLFIPFAEAWKAVKEFLETDGQHLPRSIEWVDCRTFNKDTFPEPWANVEEIDIPTP